jgi:hypothetical protein
LNIGVKPKEKGETYMKRSSYIMHDETVPLGKRGVTIWAYGRTGRYVCRLEVNATGISIYSGKKGGLKIANVNWEKLVKKLKAKR